MCHTWSWFRYSDVLKCPVSITKHACPSEKQEFNKEPSICLRCKRKTFPWEATGPELWASELGHLRDREEVVTKLQSGLNLFIFLWGLSKIPNWIPAIRSQPQSPNVEFPGLRPRAWHPEATSLVHDGVGSRGLQKWRCSLTPRDQTRKGPTADGSAGEDAGSSLFSWCEWITTLILRD